ncbi:zinc finger protein 606 [Peromyscus leucopus]|uniref:zinc finger protein 606 n=1 Tax=Peromyscus leucopus TaxID=10041 RepID=UPI001884E80B|nr:zinc finger protein 606 [Peromyscus leucopus]
MAAINPWPSWGTLMDQSWGMAAADSAISWALCPQDPAWYIEGSPEDEGRRAAGLLAAQVQVRWHLCFFFYTFPKDECPGFPQPSSLMWFLMYSSKSIGQGGSQLAVPEWGRGIQSVLHDTELCCCSACSQS